MSRVKRLRIFAGPNGSDKSTFIRKVIETPPDPHFKLGYYINADDIEQCLRSYGQISLFSYGINTTTEEIRHYFKHSTFAPIKLKDPELWKQFDIMEDQLTISDKNKVNSYIAADIAEFIRQRLLHSSCSFSYETVMSDTKKISFLEQAKKEGYKIYLYYFATEDPLINISRVEVRVAENGHNVDEDTVKKRYYKSLENLRSAVKLSDRAYLFDNSQLAELIAEITDGENVQLIDETHIPAWFEKYLL